jgi:dihydrofolate reductase
MRKLSVNTFMTLDGVMQAPGGPEEDTSDGFKHGGWSVNYWDERMGQLMDELSSRPFDLLLGRKTYEIFAAYWPHSTDEAQQSMADKLNNARKYVASRTLQSVDWQNSTLLKGDVGQAVAKLKEESGPEIQVMGSANLTQTLLKHDLIDQFGIWVFPLVLGSGKRLFGDGTIPEGLKVTRSESFSTGVVYATYERAGEIPYGTFASEEPSKEEIERREAVARG